MIFVDTSAFIALIEKRDKFHKNANVWWSKHIGVELFTSNLVAIETLGWIRYNCGKKIAVEVGKNLLSGVGIRIERVSIRDEQEAWELFQKLDGRGISMIDCTSFIVMKRLRIKEVFTFDQDFKNLGFKVYPS